MKFTDIVTFNFLRENKIVVEVKTKLAHLIQEKKADLKVQLLDIVAERKDGYKEIAVDFIMAKIELPLILKPFKGIVKKAIAKNIDKLIDFIQIKIQEV